MIDFCFDLSNPSSNFSSNVAKVSENVDNIIMSPTKSSAKVAMLEDFLVQGDEKTASESAVVPAQQIHELLSHLKIEPRNPNTTVSIQGANKDATCNSSNDEDGVAGLTTKPLLSLASPASTTETAFLGSFPAHAGAHSLSMGWPPSTSGALPSPTAHSSELALSLPFSSPPVKDSWLSGARASPVNTVTATTSAVEQPAADLFPKTETKNVNAGAALTVGVDGVLLRVLDAVGLAAWGRNTIRIEASGV